MFLKFLAFSVVVIMLGVASFVFVNNNLVSRKGEIVITDKDLASQGGGEATGISMADESVQGAPESISVPGETSREITRTLGDLSTITTTIDGFGNKTETRVFRSHSRLRMVRLQTTANGYTKAIVYGHLGGLKVFTGEEAASVLSVTADQLANKAEMFETRLDKERRLPKLADRRRSLEPIPSSEIEMNPMPSGTGSDTENSSGKTVSDSE